MPPVLYGSGSEQMNFIVVTEVMAILGEGMSAICDLHRVDSGIPTLLRQRRQAAWLAQLGEDPRFNQIGAPGNDSMPFKGKWRVFVLHACSTLCFLNSWKEWTMWRRKKVPEH